MSTQVDTVAVEVHDDGLMRTLQRPLERTSRHRRIAMRRRDGIELYQFNATKTPPHLVKRRNRAANRRARASRKANR